MSISGAKPALLGSRHKAKNQVQPQMELNSCRGRVNCAPIKKHDSISTTGKEAQLPFAGSHGSRLKRESRL